MKKSEFIKMIDEFLENYSREAETNIEDAQEKMIDILYRYFNLEYTN